MADRNIHVVPHRDGRWAVKMQNEGEPIEIHTSKSDAEQVARNLAKKKKVDVIIHKADGSVQEAYSPGNDPAPPLGK
jgi:hypothetical protein